MAGLDPRPSRFGKSNGKPEAKTALDVPFIIFLEVPAKAGTHRSEARAAENRSLPPQRPQKREAGKPAQGRARGHGIGYGCAARRTPPADQTGEGCLEAPEGAAGRPFEDDVAVVLAAKGEVGRGQIAVRDRHKPQDEAARVDLQDAVEPGGGDLQVALDVVVQAIGAAVAQPLRDASFVETI